VIYRFVLRVPKLLSVLPQGSLLWTHSSPESNSIKILGGSWAVESGGPDPSPFLISASLSVTQRITIPNPQSEGEPDVRVESMFSTFVRIGRELGTLMAEKNNTNVDKITPWPLMLTHVIQQSLGLAGPQPLRPQKWAVLI
jgi:hypothetical protein